MLCMSLYVDFFIHPQVVFWNKGNLHETQALKKTIDKKTCVNEFALTSVFLEVKQTNITNAFLLACCWGLVRR